MLKEHKIWRSQKRTKYEKGNRIEYYICNRIRKNI